MGARSQTRAQEAIREIKSVVPTANITFLAIDLSSFDSIKKAAASVLQDCDRLDVLMNNAGLMGVPPGLTEDGFEMQFGSNHMVPALFTRLLLPLLEKTAKLPNSDVRVVQVSSDAFQFAPKEVILFSQLKTPLADLSGRARYGQSKLANLYFIRSLARRHPNIKCVSLHPGLVDTAIATNTKNNYPYLSCAIDIAAKIIFSDVHTGALGQLWAATGPSHELQTGAYYRPPKKKVQGNKVVDDDKLAEKLWEWTEQQFVERGV